MDVKALVLREPIRKRDFKPLGQSVGSHQYRINKALSNMNNVFYKNQILIKN